MIVSKIDPNTRNELSKDIAADQFHLTRIEFNELEVTFAEQVHSLYFVNEAKKLNNYVKYIVGPNNQIKPTLNQKIFDLRPKSIEN